MIGNYVFELCILSLLCGVFINLMPKGGVKDISCVLCAAILISNILSDFEKIEFEEYLSADNIISEIEADFSGQVSESEKNIKRKVMEQQYEEYILDRASELGMNNSEIKIATDEAYNSYFLPFSIELRGEWNDAQKEQLTETITEYLGIPAERQVWISG